LLTCSRRSGVLDNQAQSHRTIKIIHKYEDFQSAGSR
jgi:hypothetical protein